MYMFRSQNPGEEEEEEEVGGGEAEMITEPEVGCCFIRPAGFHCWERMTSGGPQEGWATTTWKKMREWSELVAGPRWKTFIRRFGRNRAATTQMKFGYDPLSYARNFDDGQHSHSDEDVGYRPDFSSRYAVLPMSAKSSMDLGGDGPSF